MGCGNWARLRREAGTREAGGARASELSQEPSHARSSEGAEVFIVRVRRRGQLGGARMPQHFPLKAAGAGESPHS